MEGDREDDGGLLMGEEEGRQREAGDEMRQRLQAGCKPTTINAMCEWHVHGTLAHRVKCI